MEYNNINSALRSIAGLFVMPISEVLLGKELGPIDPFGFLDCFLSSSVRDTSTCLIKVVNDRAGNANIQMARLIIKVPRITVAFISHLLICG